MAKQRRPASSSAGRREARVGSRSRPGGSGGTVVVLVLLALVATGGYLLFRHTAPLQHHPEDSADIPAAAPAPITSLRRAQPGALQGNPQPAAPTAPSSSGGSPTVVPEPPFGEGEDVFETGAKVYVAHCAGCHGRPGAPAAMSGGALQLWDPHAPAVARMVARPPGALYLQIVAGVAPTNGDHGMPGYRHVLSETQMWDLALLLRNARQELPDPVLHLLRGDSKR